MRIPAFLAGLLAVLGTVAGGSLECTPPKQAFAQHHGAELYGRMCAVCHGLKGEGYKADQAPAIGHADYLATTTDEFLHRAINDGRANTTMSAWGVDHGGPLKTRDVDSIVAFMRTWQDDATPLDEHELKGAVAKGGEIYMRECNKCHGARGTGGTYLNIGGAQLLATASDGFLRYAIVHGRPGTMMPAFESTLDPQGIDDLISQLREWQKAVPLATQRATPAKPPPIPLGPVPLNPKGPEPNGFQSKAANQPGGAAWMPTKSDIIKRELDRGAKMALLDARAPSDYVNEHIAGAVSVPFYEPEPYFAQLPRDAWIVCYCACPHAESGQLASKLIANGFVKVTVLDEGLGYWRGHGYATHTGMDP